MNPGTIVNRGTTLLTDSPTAPLALFMANALARVLSAARICVTPSPRVLLLRFGSAPLLRAASASG